MTKRREFLKTAGLATAAVGATALSAPYVRSQSQIAAGCVGTTRLVGCAERRGYVDEGFDRLSLSRGQPDCTHCQKQDSYDQFDPSNKISTARHLEPPFVSLLARVARRLSAALRSDPSNGVGLIGTGSIATASRRC